MSETTTKWTHVEAKPDIATRTKTRGELHERAKALKARAGQVNSLASAKHVMREMCEWMMDHSADQ